MEEVKRFKRRRSLFLSLLVIIYAVMQTWLFIKGIYTLEPFVMSTLSVLLLFIGLVGGLRLSIICALISVLAYGFLTIYLHSNHLSSL